MRGAGLLVATSQTLRETLIKNSYCDSLRYGLETMLDNVPCVVHVIDSCVYQSEVI